MKKEQKLYQVFHKIISSNDFGEEHVQDISLGFTKASSPEKAISNVKHTHNIKKRNFYTVSNYLTNCLEKHKYYAVEQNK